MPRSSNLTRKQKRFIQEYLIDLNATQAAIRAGYSKKTAGVIGDENLKKPYIAKAIEESQQKRCERIELNQDYVLKTLLDTVERCKQALPVLDRKGKPVMVETPNGEMAAAYVFDPKNVISGAELLGKHVGMFANKILIEDVTGLAEKMKDRRNRASKTE